MSPSPARACFISTRRSTQDDTNWIVILKDVGPDVGVQTARDGERDISELPERELTRGWLKASHRAIDPTRSLPGRPWHPLTRAARKPVVPARSTNTLSRSWPPRMSSNGATVSALKLRASTSQ